MESNLSIVKNQFKELPNNIDAEQAVIGSILVSNDIFDEIGTIISSINFYDPMHQKIFEAIESLVYKGMLANPITLKNYFEDEKDDLNVPVKPSMIQPVEEIKSLGKFKVKISLHSEVDAEITISVSSADTIQ